MPIQRGEKATESEGYQQASEPDSDIIQVREYHIEHFK